VISSRTGLDRPGQVLAQQNGERPTARQLVAYFAAKALPAGSGLYQMLYAGAGDISTINWVQNTSTFLVDATGSDLHWRPS
jgi:hypothetical protein